MQRRQVRKYQPKKKQQQRKRSAIVRNPSHFFTRYASLSSIVAPATATDPVYGAISFKLSDVPGSSEFISLFDQFRINAVKVSFIPVLSEITTQTSGAKYSSRLFTCLDYTNAFAPSSVDTVREYQNSQWAPYGKIHTRFIYPKAAVDVLTSGSATLPRSSWYSTSLATTALHYGLLYAFEGAENIATGATIYKVEVKYYLAFRSVK